MSYRNERFNNSMLSLERIFEQIDPGKAAFLSDNGKAAEDMYDEIDRHLAEEERGLREGTGRTGHAGSAAGPTRPDCASCESCGTCAACPVSAAIALLVAIGEGRLAPTLVEIVRNGTNREESICALR